MKLLANQRLERFESGWKRYGIRASLKRDGSRFVCCRFTRPMAIASRRPRFCDRTLPGSGRPAQSEIDVHRIVWENHTVARAIEHAGVDERRYVAMHGLHIPANPAGHLTDR
jgi:hypothetical protein